MIIISSFKVREDLSNGIVCRPDLIKTTKPKNIYNTISDIIDAQYDHYIKSQTISNEEKLAVKKFIEFTRRNLNKIRDTEHYIEIK